MCFLVLLLLNTIYTYIYILLLFRLAVAPLYFPRNNTYVAPIMLINALEFHAPPEPVVVVHLPVVVAGCSPNVTFSIISAPVGQKCFIFPMDFNNSYLRLISSILDRSARCMIPVVPRTCRFCGAKNDTNSQRILTILLFLVMRPSKILLPPLVLDTFSCCLYFCMIATVSCRH